MLTTIEYQGYTIKTPEAPSEPGDFKTSPTKVQIIDQVDQTFYWRAPNAEAKEFLTGTVEPEVSVEGTVTFQCYWESIDSVVLQNTQEQESTSYITGITTSDSDTKTFGMAFGVEADILPGIGASLSASFSQSETHTVSLAASRSESKSFTGLPGTTLQVWQLHAQYVAEYQYDGQAYRHELESCGSKGAGVILGLTYPENAAAAAGSGA